MINQLPTQGKRTLGFTLIEVMVAVAIFAILSSALFPFLKKTLEVNSRVDALQTKMTDLQRLFIYMDNDFRFVTAHKVRDALDGLSSAPSFALDTNDGELIKFATMHADISTGESRPSLVAWQLTDDKLQRKTWRSISPYIDEEPTIYTMAKGVDDVVIEVTDETDSLTWTNSWDNNDAVPRGMRVTVTYSNGHESRRVFELAQTVDLISINSQNGTGAGGTGAGGTGTSGLTQASVNASGEITPGRNNTGATRTRRNR